jgi:hypothetical protein
MTDDQRLRDLLRSALPPTPDVAPPRDLWPRVARRLRAPSGWSFWSWVDVGLAAAVVIALVLFPKSLWLLAYHL